MQGVYEPGVVLLGKFRVDRVIGSGGMGYVLRATHLYLGDEVAIKVLLPELTSSPETTARFVREAQAVARLRGEHVARISDVGMLPGGAPYMIMEYLRGTDLAGEIERRGALPAEEVVDYVLQACEALAEAHALHIVHRDLKPANLFVTARPDGSPLIKVLDFGISKAPILDGLVTNKATIMGTPGYMSPEQIRSTSEVDARSDVWSLGVVLYECLEGRLPFASSSFQAMAIQVMHDPAPVMRARLPRGLAAVVMRCLEKERDARYPSIAALAAALAPYARDQRAAATVVDRTRLLRSGAIRIDEQAPRSGPTAPTTTGKRAGTPRYGMAGAFLAALAAALGMGMWSGSQLAGAMAQDTEPGMVAPLGAAPTRAPIGAATAAPVAPVAPAATSRAPVVAPPAPAARAEPVPRVRPHATASASTAPPVATPSRLPRLALVEPDWGAPRCAGFDIDAALAYAREHARSGDAQAALPLAERAAECRPGNDSLVVSLACTVGDRALARRYYARLSAGMQRVAAQVCKRHDVTLP